MFLSVAAGVPALVPSLAPTTVAAGGCIRANSWICPAYLQRDSDAILSALRQHVTLTLAAVGLALVVAVPLALLARRTRWLRTTVLGVGGVVYTIPSLALFVLLAPFFGYFSPTPVVVALAAYNVQVIVRNLLVGLDEVPPDATEAARGMGYGPGRLLTHVELPLALPSIMAGLRIATVSTIALATVGIVVGAGGLGTLIYGGLQSNDFHPEIATGLVLVLLLGIAADLLLLGVQRLATPWTRRAGT